MTELLLITQVFFVCAMTVFVLSNMKSRGEKKNVLKQHAEEKLESLSEKKDKIIKELEDPVHQKAFSKAKKETGKLLKRWKPKVIKGTVRFGFEDPCHTGQALAAFSIIYPFIGEFLSIEPNFERRILKGDIKVRGGFRMVPLVCFLWNLVWCREIRKTYHDIREFQL